MLKFRGFLLGLGGGAVGAVAGDARARPRVRRRDDLDRPSCAPAARPRGLRHRLHDPSGLSPAPDLQASLSGGVVMVLSDFGSSGTGPFGQRRALQALGTGFVVDEQGYILTNAHVVDETGQRADAASRSSSTRAAPRRSASPASWSASTWAATWPSSRSTRARLTLNPLPLGDSDNVAGRRAGRGHRQPAGLRLLHHLRHRLGHRPQPAGARTARRSPTASRPTPPSTRATRAAR